MAQEPAGRRRSYLTPPRALVVLGTIFFLALTVLIVFNALGVWPFGDDEGTVRDVLEEDWGDEAEDDVTLPGEEPAAFRVGDLEVVIAA